VGRILEMLAGMDVHQTSISIAVRDAAGKVVMERIIAAAMLEFI
jgi:hypothetical protein